MAGGGDDDAKRRAHLTDPAIHKKLTAIIRDRGVPAAQVKDVLQSVLTDVLEHLDRLPVEPREALAYLCQTARFSAIDDGRARDTEEDYAEERRKNWVEPSTLHPTDARLARALMESAQKKDPRKFAWWVRSFFYGETHAEIGASEGVAPVTVRLGVKSVAQFFKTAEGKASLVALAVLLAVFFNVNRWLDMTGGTLHEKGELSSVTRLRGDEPSRPNHPVNAPELEGTPDAATLRLLALDAATRGDWDIVRGDLFIANMKDLSGETPELAKLYDEASDRLAERDAKPGDMPRRHHHAPAQPLPDKY